jgi:guanine deaminase
VSISVKRGALRVDGRRPEIEGDPNFMKQAIALATANVAAGGGPFGAVIVRDGAVMATGVNQVTLNNDPTAHAEVVAIRAACEALNDFQLTGCVVYTSCEPCPMCLSAIYWARCDAIYYGNSSGDAAAAGFDDSLLYDEVKRTPNERRIPTKQLLGDEAIASFRAWQAKTDKVEY